MLLTVCSLAPSSFFNEGYDRMAKFSRRNLYRRASRKNNRSSRKNNRSSRNNRRASRKNIRRNSRKQRGGDANDGGYGQSQQYFNPDWARPSGPAFNAAFSTAPTAEMIRPVLAMSPQTDLRVIQGAGSAPEFQQSQIGAGRRKKRTSGRKNRSIKKNRK
jgi:hypothetical protein